MRKQLKKLDGKRLIFEAVVGRFGTKTGFNGEPVKTILFKFIRTGGQVVTSHLWFTCGKWSDILSEGDKFTFEARVSEYVKGYKGWRIDERWEKLDYKLERPTKVKVIDYKNIESTLPLISTDSFRKNVRSLYMKNLTHTKINLLNQL